MNRCRTRRRGEGGQALLIVLVVGVMLMALGLTLTTTVRSASDRRSSSSAQMRRLYIAESGIKDALMNISSGGTGNRGTAGAPLPYGGGQYFTTAVDNADFSYTITSRGIYGRGRRVLEVLVRERGHVFSNAIFAGNSSGDLNYTVNLGGTGSEADEVHGDIYSGNDITVTGDAGVNGNPRAKGQVHGVAGEDGTDQPPFDFGAMDYAGSADIHVNNEFAAEAFSASDDTGGTADQVPETNPAHIFRRNPSDRSSVWSSTPGDDYFLEDPYAVIGRDPDQNGTTPFIQTLTAPPNTNGQGLKQVIYIEGNLWLHNFPTYSFSFESIGPLGTQLTFVVKGNIYFSDNVFLQNPDRDAVAFIAIENPDVPGTGNISFGDPSAGTLEFMQAFLYAENNFYDQNMSASGSSVVEVVGTMAAGNHVAIDRDFPTHHSKLIARSDPRLANGDVSLPGLPTQTAAPTYDIVTWLEVSPNR